MTSACAHCGGGDFGEPVTAVARGVVLAYCSAGCRDDHAVALELVPTSCEVQGCDRDAVGDLPRCAEHAGGEQRVA